MFDKAELAKLPQGSVAIAGENFRQNCLSLEYKTGTSSSTASADDLVPVFLSTRDEKGLRL